MKKALILENWEEVKKIHMNDDFIRDDFSTQKKYSSHGELKDGTIILFNYKYDHGTEN